jgi:hypothetical protein
MVTPEMDTGNAPDPGAIAASVSGLIEILASLRLIWTRDAELINIRLLYPVSGNITLKKKFCNCLIF